MCTSTRTTSGSAAADPGHGSLDVASVTDDLDLRVELRADARPEEIVVVDDEDPRTGHDGRSPTGDTAAPSGSASSISVPVPGAA